MRLCKNVVVDRFNLRKNAAVDTDERPERGPTVAADQIKQRDAFFIESPGTVGFEAHQLHERRTRDPAGKVTLRASIAPEIFLRKVNAAHGKILRYIVQDIRQLKSDPKLRSEHQRLRIRESEHMHAAQTDCAGDTVA